MKLSDSQTDNVLEALRASKIKGPGPQSYLPNTKKFMVRSPVNINFGNQGRFELLFKERQWRQNPGPGTYHEESPRGSIQNTFRKKPKSSQRDTWSRSQRKGIEYFMGRDKDLVNESPGPASYVLPKLIGDMPTYALPKIPSKN